MSKSLGITCPNCSHELKVVIESKPRKEVIQDQEFAGEVFASFPVVGGPKGEWLLHTLQVSRWETLFPGIDVKRELGNALAWCESNPKRRKTVGGMSRFLSSWLTRAQNNRGGKPQTKEEMMEALGE